MALKDSLDKYLPESLKLDFLTALKDSLDKHLLESLELESLTALKESLDTYLLESLDFLKALEDSMDSLLARFAMLVIDGCSMTARSSSPNSRRRPATSTAEARTAPVGGS